MPGPLNTDPAFIDLDGDDEVGEAQHDQKEEYRELLEKVQGREEVFKKGWWKDAVFATKLYDGSSTSAVDDDKAYNILYSNTEVLLPSLYSATPKPDIRGRFVDVDVKPIPSVVERYLTLLSDPGNPGIESFDDALSETVLSALVPGLGFSRLRYYKDRAMPLAVESGHYKGLIWAKARKWSKCPWIAFRHELTSSELFAQFKIPENERNKFKEMDDENTEERQDDKPRGTVVYEVWVKASKKIIFLCGDWDELCLRVDDDVLQLAGFYPTPGPLLLTMQPGELNPVPLFQYYRNQAQELNRITVRLNKVISAIRVRGAYNGLLGKEMETLLSQNEMENALIPASEAAILAAQGGGFERHIWMLPIEKLITVATSLYQAREAIKSVIYELTGISDIIRGSSVASETATAQDLKNKWGTVRLRKMQTIVANYVRDLYRLAVDGATSVVTVEQWKAITQLPIPTKEEQTAAQQQIQMGQQQYALAVQQAQMAQQQPPAPPEIPPQLQAQAQGPSWEEVIAKISSDANRVFLINVQNASTIDLDTSADKADVTEFMGALGQILPGLGQFTQLGDTGLEASKAILLGICKRFKFGLDMLPAIEGIQAPEQPPPVDPEQQKQLEDGQKQIQEGQAQLAQEKEALTKLQEQLKALETQLTVKHAELKSEATRIEAARKVLDSDQKVATISISADKKVLEASRQLAKAETTINDMKQKEELKALIPEPEPQTPAPEPVDLSPLQKSLEQAEAQIKELSQKLAEVSKKPKRLVKTVEGAWMPEY